MKRVNRLAVSQDVSQQHMVHAQSRPSVHVMRVCNGVWGFEFKYIGVGVAARLC